MIKIAFDKGCEWENKQGPLINTILWCNQSKLVDQTTTKTYKISVLRHYTQVGVFLCLKNKNGEQKGFYYIDNGSDLKAISLKNYLLESINDIICKEMN